MLARQQYFQMKMLARKILQSIILGELQSKKKNNKRGTKKALSMLEKQGTLFNDEFCIILNVAHLGLHLLLNVLRYGKIVVFYAIQKD